VNGRASRAAARTEEWGGEEGERERASEKERRWEAGERGRQYGISRARDRTWPSVVGEFLCRAPPARTLVAVECVSESVDVKIT